MQIKDYYKILGVEKNTPEAEIKKRYRELAKKYHPDANPGNKQAEEKFKEINQAYEILSNKEKRAKYEQLRDAQAKGFDFSSFRQGKPKSYPGGIDFDIYSIFTDLFGEKSKSGPSGGFEDIFDMFFQGSGRNTASQQAARKTRDRGDDLTARISIPFALSLNGGETIIKVPRIKDCSRCRGTGVEPGASLVPCPMCGGKGAIDFAQGGFMIQKTCPQCSGKGQQPTLKCRQCGGAGELSETKQVKVKIPAGVKEGDRIRIKGEGNMYSWNKQRGDLYVEFGIEPSVIYKRKGDDIFYTANINLAQAVLGARTRVPTPEGEVILKIPEGASEGMILKVAGQGAKNIVTGKRGDFFVTVKVRIEAAKTAEERKLIEEYAKLKNYKI